MRTSGSVMVQVDAPPARVYDLVADITRIGEFSPECRGARWLGEVRQPAPGARFRGRNVASPLLRWSRTCEVVTADPGREFSFRTLPTPAKPDSTVWRYRFEPAGSGVEVTECYEIVKPPPRPVLALYRRLLPHHLDMRPHMRRTLEAIKHTAESENAPLAPLRSANRSGTSTTSERSMRAGDELENPVTGERAIVRQGSEDTQGEYLLCDLFVGRGGRVALPHLHPGLTETFEVLAGRLDVVVGDRRSIAVPGDKVSVPAGTVHDWWNEGDGEAHVLAEVRGPGVARFETVLATLWALGRDGKTNDKGVPNLLQLAVTFREFSDALQVAKPSPILQGIAFGVLAPIGRALGYRPVYPDKRSAPQPAAPS